MSFLCRNLFSSIPLNKAGLKTVVREGKIVIAHNGVFVGKGYMNESLFILNLASKTMNGNASSSANIAEHVDLWHGRSGYVNVVSIKQLKNVRLIPTLNVDNFSKCPTYVKAKHAKKSFKPITSRKKELL